MLPTLVLTYLPSLLCGIHAVRSGQQMYWLWILVIAPLLGPLIYFFAVLVPEFADGRRPHALCASSRRPRPLAGSGGAVGPKHRRSVGGGPGRAYGSRANAHRTRA